MRRNNPTLALALEMIHFQSDKFFGDLVTALTALRAEAASQMAKSDAAANLLKVIKRHTNLSVSLSFSEQEEAAILVPHIDRNHPVLQNWVREYIDVKTGQKLLATGGGVARGSVDLKAGRVSGVWAETSAVLYLAPTIVQGKKYEFTLEELAAVVLHEIGHYFTYCEYISRMVATNQALAQLSKALDGSAGPDEREIVLMSVKESLKLKDLNAKELAQSEQAKVVETVVVTAIVRETRSELGANIYDDKTWEYLADQYAARYGAGRHLIFALDKLTRSGNSRSYRSTFSFLFYEALKTVLTICPITWAIGMLLVIADSDGTFHEEPEARAKRIRNQLVERLKDQKLSGEMVQRLTTDLEAVDEILSKVEDRRQFFGVIGDALFRSSRRNWNQTKLQKQLEDLAASDLFVHAAKFKQLT